MKVIFLIARDSIKYLLHQRLLLALILLSLVMTGIYAALMLQMKTHIAANYDAPANAATNSPDWQKMDPKQRKQMNEAMEQSGSVMEGMFYGACSFGGSLVALWIFSTAVVSEVRQGVIRLTLSKPVTRNQYLLGKYLGGVAVMLAYACISSLAIIAFTRISAVEISPVLKYAPWLMLCRQLMLGSVAMLFSLFVSPPLAAVLAFFCGNGLCSSLSNPFHYILLSYASFQMFFNIVQGTLVTGHDVLLLTLYALDVIVIMLLLALWRFRTKEVC